MSRPLRIEYAGAWYHVMNRGACRQIIYIDEAMRNRFLSLMGEMGARYGIECHAYCLMDNHYHLLLRTPNGQLSRGMRHINGLYTQYYNSETGSDGPLFRGRYKALLVDADSYLMQVSRYIHRNPLEAGMVKQLKDYPWSSYPYYADGRKSHAWLHCDEVLGQISSNRQHYRYYVEESLEEDELIDFYAKERLPPILGSEEFVESISGGTDKGAVEIADTRRIKAPVSAEALLALVIREYKITRANILSRNRPRGRITEARNMFMYLCQTQGQMKLEEIADRVGLGHYTSVSSEIRRFKEGLKEDVDLHGRLARVLRKLNVH